MREGEAAPPLPWTGEGSRVLRAFRSLRGAADFLGPALSALDRAAALLAARPLPILAGALVGVPLARLVLPGGAAAIAAVALGGLAGSAALLAACAALHRGDEGRLASRALVAGLLLRALLAAAVAAAGGFPDELGSYDLLARDVAESWAGGGASLLSGHPLSQDRWAYYGLLSIAYLLLGPAVEVGRLLGILVGAAAALVAGEAARPLGGRRAAALAVAVLALHPEQALWNATLSRDGLSTLLILLALAVLLRPPGGLLRARTLLAAGPLALLALNSLPAFLAASAGIVAAAAAIDVASRREGRGAAVRAGLAVVVAAAAAAWVLDRHGPWMTPGGISLLRNGVFQGDVGALASRGAVPADFFPGLRFEGPADVLLYLPAGAAFALFAPWPWEAVHLHRAAYGVLALAGAAISVLGIVGLGAAVRRAPRAAAIPAAAAASFLLVLALLEGNGGIAARHRLPLGAILAVGAGVLLAGRAVTPATASADGNRAT